MPADACVGHNSTVAPLCHGEAEALLTDGAPHVLWPPLRPPPRPPLRPLPRLRPPGSLLLVRALLATLSARGLTC